MSVGIPREIKNNEFRVGLTPPGARELRRRGIQVHVETGAGEGSGYSDGAYAEAGAEIVASAADLYACSELIVKVKEPLPAEYAFIGSHHTVFTFFHFSSSETLTRAMLSSGATCIAYETVERDDRALPLLAPMSEIAGRMAVHAGAHYLEKPRGGPGILPGGVPGVAPAKTLIIGGGIVGTQAAKVAAGLGMNVSVLDVDLYRLRYLADIMPANVNVLISHDHNIRKLVRDHHLIIGAVLIHGARAPHLIDRDMLGTMMPGTVIVDVDVDQGGCVETSRPTTHEEPAFVVDGVLHYCVANMPGAVPRTSTEALVNATLPYVVKLAEHGWKQACAEDSGLRRGVNIVQGDVTCPPVAETFGLACRRIEELL